MQKQTFSQKKIIIPAILIVILAILFLTGKPALDRRNSDKNTPSNPTQSGVSTDSDNVDPVPTEDPDNQKDRNLERDKIDKTTAPTPEDQETETTKTPVSPVITYVGQQGTNLEVGALITGIYEGGGTCTLTITKGSYVYTKQQPAIKNATTTDCQYFIIPTSEITEKGSVQITMSYESPVAKGVSEQKEVSIQ